MSKNVAVFKGLSDSKKSAKVMVKRNEFEVGGGTFGFMAPEPFKDLKVGETLEVPVGWSTESRANQDGEVMTHKDGNEVQFFVWS